MGSTSRSGLASAGRFSSVQFKLYRALLAVFLVFVLGAGLRLIPSGGSYSLSLTTASADDVEYVYDELGRLVQASNRTLGQAVIYSYDAVGNINSQTAVQLTTLSLGYFSPNHGPAGTAVTLSGTGFSSTASANTVKFNGSVAPVVTASQTQLVVSVPSAATTGPISVQVGSAIVTSSTSFTVTAQADGPVITGLFPPLGTAGQIVTVVGSGFESVAVEDRVRFNTTSAPVTSSTTTNMSTNVPAGAGSGKVVVTTPRGMAVSPMDFIVVPSGYSSGSIGSTGRLPVDGSSNPIALPTARVASIQLFDGKAGDLLTLGVTSTTISSCTIKVFNPDGTALTAAAGVTVTAAGQGVQLPKLPTSGTYTLVADPGANTGTISLSIVSPLQATLSLGGTPTQVTLAPPGRRALLTFAGSAGTYANLNLSAVTVTAGTVSIFSPNGGLLDSRPFTTAGVSLQPQLPVNGTYTVLIDPAGSVGGSLTVGLTAASTPTLGVNQGPFNLNLTNTTPATVTFQGTTGQYLALAVIEGGGNISAATISVAGPDGVVLTTGRLTATFCGGLGCTSSYSGSTLVNMGPLPVGGTYTVTIQETATATGTLTLVVSSPLTDTLTSGNTSSESTTQVGQPVLLTFAGAAGDFPALAITEDNGQVSGATISVFRPDGSLLSTGTFAATICTGFGCPSGYKGQGIVNMGPLPESGNYTAVIQQTAAVGTGGLAATLSSPLVDTLAAGTSNNEQTTLTGQSVVVSFTGTTGKYLALALSESGGLIPGATVKVFAPDDTLISQGTFAPTICTGLGCSSTYSGVGVVNVGPLPQAGTYTAVIQQIGAVGTGNLTVSLSNPLSQTLTPGTPVNESTSLPGQPMQLTFNGATGQYLALALSESGGLIPGAVVTVLQPDGKQFATGTFTPTICTGLGCSSTYSGFGIINLGPLVQAGTYTVLVQQSGASGTGVLTVTLSNPLAGTLTAGSAADEQTTLLGQPMQLTFNGGPGAIFALAVAENGGQIPGAKISILAPDGSIVTSTTFSPANCSGGLGCVNQYTGSTLLNMGPLTQAGAYNVLIQQTAALGTGDLTLTLSGPVVSALSSSGPTSVQTTLTGQPLAATFTGASGSSVSLTVAEASSPITGATIKLINPDGTPLASGNLSPSLCSGCTATYTGSVSLFPETLTQNGTYTIVAQQKSAVNGQLTFSATGLASTPQTNFSLSTSTPGAAGTFSFAGITGQTLNVAVTNIVLSPSSPTSLSLRVTRPDGNIQYSVNCTVSAIGCQLPMWSLPQTGTYTVSVTPGSAQTFTANAQLTPASVSSLSPGTPVSANLSSPGQMGIFNFTASAGQDYALNIGALTSVPVNTTYNVQLYNSSGGLYQLNTSTAAGNITFNLQNMPADTYTLLLWPSVASTSSLQVTLQSGVTGTVASDGTSSAYSTGQPGQIAYLNFAGTAGQSMSLVLTNVSLTPAANGTSFSVQVLRPDGGSFTSVGCTVSANGCAIPLYKLPQTGTYALNLSPSGTQKVSATLQLITDVNAVLAAGTPYNLALGTPGQQGTLSFTASAGQTYALNIGAVTSLPANTTYNVQLYNSSGGLYQINTSTASGNITFNLQNMPADTYTLFLWPSVASTSSLQVTLQSGVTGTVASDGTSSTYSTGQPGQIAYLHFAGTAGQSMSLVLTNASLTPAANGTSFSVQVLRPDGGSFTSVGCTVSANGCAIPLYKLPQTGTYALNLTPSGTQKVSATLQLITDVNAVLAVGTPYNLALGTPGQQGTLSFTASAGQTYALNIGAVTSLPANTTYNVQLYNSSGGLYQLNTSTAAGNITFNLQNMPADTYTLFLWSSVASTTSMQVTLQSGVTGTVASDGTSSTYSTGQPGQIAYLHFAGTAGQSMSLVLTNASLTPAANGTSFSVQVLRPDGGSFTSVGCTVSANGCAIPLYKLPQTGTYALNLSPSGTQKVSATLQLISDVNAVLAAGTPYNLALGTPGQQGTLSFTASAGQTYALNIGAVTSLPANTTYNVQLYNSSGGLYQINTSTAAGNITFNLQNMPADTYTLFLWSSVASTSSLQVTLQSGVTGTVASDGTSSTYSTGQPGQIAYLNFAGTAGQSMSLVLTNVSLTPAANGTSFSVQVLRPDGGSFTSVGCTVSANGCAIPLYKLPQTGTYALNLSPSGTQKVSATLQLITDVNAVLAAGTPYNLALGTPGQQGTLSFTASAGQTYALNIGAVTSLPANTTYNVQLYNSSGGLYQLNTSTAAGNITYNLQNMPADTYTLFLWSTVASTTSMQVTLQSGVTGSVASDGTSSTYSTGQPGQIAYLNFAGTAGQSMSLVLTNASLTPAANGTSFSVQVLRPDGGSFTSVGCTVSANGCAIPLYKLPQTGTYALNLTPSGTQKVSATLQLISDVNAALTAASAFNLNLSIPGQDGILTFTATAGQTIALTVSGISSVPTGTSYLFQVFNPSGSTVTSTSSASGATLNLANLAAGTYTLLVYPSIASTAAMQVTYH